MSVDVARGRRDGERLRVAEPRTAGLLPLALLARPMVGGEGLADHAERTAAGMGGGLGAARDLPGRGAGARSLALRQHDGTGDGASHAFMSWTGTKAGEGFEYHVLAMGSPSSSA